VGERKALPQDPSQLGFRVDAYEGGAVLRDLADAVHSGIHPGCERSSIKLGVDNTEAVVNMKGMAKEPITLEEKAAYYWKMARRSEKRLPALYAKQNAEYTVDNRENTAREHQFRARMIKEAEAHESLIRGAEEYRRQKRAGINTDRYTLN
jgi:hypothetical protein